VTPDTGSQGERGASDVRTTENAWRPNPGLAFGLIASILLLGGGLVLSRPELVLIGAPILVVVILAWLKRPDAVDSTTVTTAISLDDTGYAHYDAVVDAPPSASAVVVRLLGRSHTRFELVATPEGARSLSGDLAVVHSGPQEIVRVDYSVIGADSGFISKAAPGPRSKRVISPRVTPLRRLPLPFRMLGLTGGHESARPGDGGEFRDIGQFVPGDRLRRIDWKVTARRSQGRGDLYVRHTFSTADATVLIVIDSRDDIGALVTPKSMTAAEADEPTSMDLAREAASSIASAYIEAGDRVGFQDLAVTSRIIAPGGGTRHLQRLLPAIAQSQPAGAPSRRVRAPLVPSGAMVYIVSTFLDEAAARMAELWRASGHNVIAVDTLPRRVPGKLTREESTALRITTMERDDRLDRMRAVGVSVVSWPAMGEITVESQLSALTRVSRGRR
jgi:uncharacterized protein (DUF58 family)